MPPSQFCPPSEVLRRLINSTHIMYVTPSHLTSYNKSSYPMQSFTYLKDKPVEKMIQSAQFLHMLQAEHDHLITIHVNLTETHQNDYQQRLERAFLSEAYTDSQKAWNAERKEAVKEAMLNFLLPMGAKWLKEWLREEVEDCVAKQARVSLETVSEIRR